MRLFGFVVDGLIFIFTSSQRDVAAAGTIGGICPGILVSVLLQYRQSGEEVHFSLFFFGMLALVAGAFSGALVGWLFRVMTPDLDWPLLDYAVGFLGGFAVGTVILVYFFPWIFF